MASQARSRASLGRPEKERLADVPLAQVSQNGSDGEGGGRFPEQSRLRRRRWRTGFRSYLFAVGMVGAATAVRWALDPLFGGAKQFITFYPAVVVAALVGGAGAGCLTTVLSALAADLFFVEPRGSLTVLQRSDWIALGFFAVAGGLISWMAGIVGMAQKREGQAIERERAAEALRQSEELHRVFFESGAVGMAYANPTGHLVKVNAKYCEICGYSREELMRKDFFDLVHPDDRAKDRVRFEAYVRGEVPVYACEKRYLRKDGSVRWVEVVARLVREADGRPRHSIGIIQDVTERKWAEDALRESEERFRAMADGTPLLIWITDAEGRNRFVNRAYCEFFGVEPDAVQELRWQQLLHPEDQVDYVEAFERAILEHKSFRAQARARRHDGMWRWIDSHAKPRFSGDGSFLGMAGSSADVTERMEFQAELKRLVEERTARLQELVGELEHFSYSITHDLKSPLRAMQGFAHIASLMCGDGVRKEAKEALEKISISAERMDALITDALNYSRSVRQELPLTDVDTGVLLRGMLDSYPELQPSKAQIQVEGKLPVVLGNEAGLTQCFSNLLGNAVKFVRPGERPQIRVWAEERNGWTRIWVEDQGIGISKEMLPRVFDMFSRGSKDYEGTGIGLALVRKVTHRMGGRVGVESEEGKGSRFWIELKSGDARPKLNRAETAPAEARGGTVLYVEDEESDAAFMKMAFDEKGMESALRVVGDGRAAIEYLSGAGKYADRKEYPLPTVVLLDLNLPQVPGFEVLRWMRNHPEFARTPVVVFSSSTREDDREKALELGADEFIGKPSSAMKFGEVVERLRERWLGAANTEVLFNAGAGERRLI